MTTDKIKKFRINVFQEADSNYMVEGKNKKDALRNFAKGNYYDSCENFGTIIGIEGIFEEYEDIDGKTKENQLKIDEKDEEIIRG